MEKIVIVTEQSEPNQYLLACLNSLFPDCEIQVVGREVGGPEERFSCCFHLPSQQT
jgi:hypothetical protein